MRDVQRDVLRGVEGTGTHQPGDLPGEVGSRKLQMAGVLGLGDPGLGCGSERAAATKDWKLKGKEEAKVRTAVNKEEGHTQSWEVSAGSWGS